VVLEDAEIDALIVRLYAPGYRLLLRDGHPASQVARSIVSSACLPTSLAGLDVIRRSSVAIAEYMMVCRGLRSMCVCRDAQVSASLPHKCDSSKGAG